MFYDCFISYASPDLPFAQALCGCLVAAGLRVWFDKSRWRDGYNRHEEIEAGCEATQGPGFGSSDYLRLDESHERAMLEDRTSGSTEYPDSLFLTWATIIRKLPAGARAVVRLCGVPRADANPVGSPGEKRRIHRSPGRRAGNGAG